ncbi:HK97 gp10 family phage protein [Halarsenatibacter silvermanii]|uniref:Bacteriophage HK97-gp10, putative tail-component n=1 Tax=Halarsenatibacter silvermanii TaxID=321763 RepID=A0A1G9REM5_9FIRM|nr:HK97 gp10 family phage protein [Halarsenatibacter silvermanii]SDM20885.1 Bacteriophage HK97-gp10, putative tail-component [Halarsenatibacter silvermanii]
MEIDAYFEDMERQLEIFDRAVKSEEKALEKALEYIVREIVNYAKKHGPWTDRTSNLRNSLGCNIKQIGEIKSGTNVSRAISRLRAKPVIEVDGDDYIGVVSAGMEYAIHVELKSGYWVLQGALDRFAPLIEKYFSEFMHVDKLEDKGLFEQFLGD